MRVVICPDKFAGTLSAVEAAEAIAQGWRNVAPNDELVLRPIADGGPGFVEVLHKALGGSLLEVPATDPLGRPVAGQVLIVGETAYIESAQATGLHHLSPAERDPKITTTRGLGTLVRAAIRADAKRIVIGLGGSATNDGGAGMLGELGVYAQSEIGIPFPAGGQWLAQCASLGWVLGNVPLKRMQEQGVEIIGASDVDSPLTGPSGASAVYGPQKGATPQDVELLDAALANWATVLERDLPTCPPKLAELPGGGAAGGLGAAILAIGGRIVSGIDLIRDLTGLDGAIAGAGVVITGEGSFDYQSLRGKVIAGVAAAARDEGIPCVVLAGRVTTGRREQGAAGVTEAHSLTDHFGSTEQAMAEPARGLRELAERVARQHVA
ncbi:glycerate kinase family protein [Catelliglobosispora koreensis]|uniref:glycerate kinase family protein n=1 Tax=Catelliglobosispora koreensis TaxID=129052 RepID=UPI000475A856|nr:glycerate kinase [Catelliglobosispora koreensis]